MCLLFDHLQIEKKNYYIRSSEILEFPNVINLDIITSGEINLAAVIGRHSGRDTPSINLTSAATPLNHRYTLI